MKNTNVCVIFYLLFKSAFSIVGTLKLLSSSTCSYIFIVLDVSSNYISKSTQDYIIFF